MDLYLRRADGSTNGPIHRGWLTGQLTEGRLGPRDEFAAVPAGVDPMDEDFQPATLDNLAAVPLNPGESSSANASLPGGLLRGAGLVIGVVGVLGSIVMAIQSAMSYDTELELLVAVQASIAALFYGGLLWAAGTVVGQLDGIKRQLARR